MAQTGFTPIQLYSSSTASNVPLAANLATGELAINITDGKLFYKDNAAAVQVIGWKTVPTSAGGTGLTSYTAGDTLYYASGTTLATLAIGATGRYLSSSGSAPQWSAPAALTKTDDTNVTLTLGGSASTALLNAASLTLGWTGTLAVTRGGTGLSTVAQGDILYSSASNTLVALAKNTTATRYLANTGTSNNPAWAQVNLANGVTGTLPTANGGTGLTAFTVDALVYASSASALAANGPIIKFGDFTVAASGGVKTVTISGVQYGTATVSLGAYASAGAGYMSRQVVVGGYQTATTTYDVTTTVSNSSASVVLGAVTKNASTVTFTITNNAATTLVGGFYGFYYGQSGPLSVTIA